jgi:hypothetical protein
MEMGKNKRLDSSQNAINVPRARAPSLEKLYGNTYFSVEEKNCKLMFSQY